MAEEEKEENNNQPQKSKISKIRAKKSRHEYQKKRVIIPTITAVILVLLGIFWAVRSTYYQTTDDAFVEGHIISVAPRVAGPVVKLLVDDNDDVVENQLIAVIDPTDYEVKLKQVQAKLDEAKANLNITERQIEESQSNVQQSTENIESAKSKYDFAQKDHKRYTDMYKAGIASKQEFDKSNTELTVAQANLNASQEHLKAAEAVLKSQKAKTEAIEAEIKRLEAEVEQAELNLSYTQIKAPQAGKVTARSVEQGNYVQVAQPILSIVPEKVWVVANYKEIQLTHMQKDEPVMIKIDTYPGKKFKGKIDSIQRATGAKSSLFPPENAVGSYVKIVQRVPVKIVFTEDISGYNIVPGMSVVPTVKVKKWQKKQKNNQE